jgi:5-methyltetrahydrofolate--homocysteine methyltransferase
MTVLTNKTNCREKLWQVLRERILVLDGAMGTALQAKSLSANDFGGSALEGCNENLNRTRPNIVADIHAEYLQAGADIIETNTFGSTRLVLAEYNLQNEAYEITKTAARLARNAADQFSNRHKTRFVAGSMGPTTKAISVTGGVSFSELCENYCDQAHALIEGGVDFLLLETAQDTRNVKAGVIGIREAFKKIGKEIPVAVSVTIETSATMLGGQAIEALAISLQHVDLLYLGLNCATGPVFMTDHLRLLAEMTAIPVAAVPNAGLPNEEGLYLETPTSMSAELSRFIDEGWINLVGGCCGTTAKHIAAFAELAHSKAPRRWQKKLSPRSFYSGIDFIEAASESRPLLVGERTNVIGSRAFKKLIMEGDFDAASEIAVKQVKAGSQIQDVCLANPDGDEKNDIHRFLELVCRRIKVPIMIDSTDAEVIELALTHCQGKGIINSINLEDGEERFAKVVPLAKKFGAALVVGTIDEDPQQGMGVTRKRKLEIAKREYDLLVNRYGVKPEDIIFDPLVFPCGTGDAQYLGSAVETIEGLKLIKAAFPACKTILGISNVSFGLPPAGREVLNSVFLYLNTQAGLDLAIVNTERLQRYASIPAVERKLAEELIFHTSDETVMQFTEHFRKQKVVDKTERTKQPLNERLAGYIVEGVKDGLVQDLNEALKTAKPIDIINGPLMNGMNEVGRLFNGNELIIAEVLQSAEVMKASVNHLKPFMDKTDEKLGKKIILATVKGDVHDIGKNLVDIIFSNNGFDVINLGIKVAPHTLIEAVAKHQPDMIGLSGLLVKSTLEMVTTAKEFKVAGISLPLLVGGAALSKNFTAKRIMPEYQGVVAYARDAMLGLELARAVTDPIKSQAIVDDMKKVSLDLAKIEKPLPAVSGESNSQRSPSIEILAQVPEPPDLLRHQADLDLNLIWSYINPAMLYGRHLGYKGRFEKQLEAKESKAMELDELIRNLKKGCLGGGMKARAVWQFVRASSLGNKIHLFDEAGTQPLAELVFPRQKNKTGLCLADFISPEREGPSDNCCLLAVTAGEGIRVQAEELKTRGEYLKCHALQALAVETAEAAAEWLHQQIRAAWGFPDSLSMTMMERFQARYRGKRYAFGYPACPDLEMQKGLFEILKPQSIGIELTDGFMMDPEASVSAMVFHHPQAAYFGV